MEATRRLQIELPEDLAEFVRAYVESGRFSSESEVVRAGLELLDDHEQCESDDEADAWLRSTIPARLTALDEGRTRTKSVDEVRKSLAARKTARDQAA